MTASQHSGHSGGSSCGNSGSSYSPWSPANQQCPPENLYNNPLPFPNGPNGSNHQRYQITPPNQQPPPLPPGYPPHQQRIQHSHYPPSHAHSDYQSYNHQNQNRRCNNTR